MTRQYAPLQLASLCTDTVQCSDPHFRGVEIKVGNVKRYSPATEKFGQKDGATNHRYHIGALHIVSEDQGNLDLPQYSL